MDVLNEWKRCETKVFWRDVATNDHVVQIYDDDAALLNTLAEYIVDGFDAGDSVIIIATGDHLEQLNKKLTIRGFKLAALIANNQYIPLDADEMLGKFMVNRVPHEKYFLEAITPVIKMARNGKRQVRAFGEMVALLWERGNSNATIQLEQLWNNLCSVESFSLFCAYPKNGFTHDASATIMHICAAHSKLITTNKKFPSQIEYKVVSGEL